MIFLETPSPLIGHEKDVMAKVPKAAFKRMTFVKVYSG
jgi:hypothetical protein